MDKMEMSQVTCFNCQGKGHFARFCKKDKKGKSTAGFQGKAKAFF
jgi:hypothetical protein